jgi:hypothetical protein
MNRFVLWRGLVAALALAVSVPSSCALAQEILVQPYVQPGDGRFLLGTDVKVISWMTDQKPGEFVVEFQTPEGLVRTAQPVRMALDFKVPKILPKVEVDKEDQDESKAKDATQKKDDKAQKDQKDDKDPKKTKIPLPPEIEQHYFKYTAYLDGLPFNTEVRYAVKMDGHIVRQATFRTRATADRSVRCVLVGDMAQGRDEQKPIAYRISQQRPEFLMALGDIVYPTGRMNQYMAYFWGTYNNVAEPGLKTGAPLMASVPFYPLLGNHDVSAKLQAVPDALAAYYVFSPPKGGPGEGPWVTKLGKDEEAIKKFRAATQDSYPNLDAYSFDNGPAHFVVMNDNKGMEIDSPLFCKWLRTDLMASAAKWKIVCFHIPPFHSSKQHYPEQQMRRLQPLFEECGVDLTFGGHVHNYQRTVPLKFAPRQSMDKKAKVDGQFTLDTTFDGIKNTRPSGVIHIVAGGGGASLYGPGLDKTVEYLHKEFGDNYGNYTARMVADEHSFVVLDLSPDRLHLRAIGINGNELDQITITKSK